MNEIMNGASADNPKSQRERERESKVGTKKIDGRCAPNIMNELGENTCFIAN
jgi:hypothetical protein